MMKLLRRSRDLVVEGKKARQYNEFSRQYRMQDMKEYAELASKYVADGGSVLDVATGPGYFCIELARMGHSRVTGFDISEDLVKIASTNARQAGVDVDFVQGSASAMQFPDLTFDLVFCSWAMKNFMEPAKVLAEMFRVLRPGGGALIVDLDPEATRQQWNQYASNRHLKGMTALAMGIAFRIQRSGAYSRAQFDEMIRNSSFRTHNIQDMGINLCVQLSK
jgi:ubiquinone/menaquinone biosynthesis C-methylase UbiE